MATDQETIAWLVPTARGTYADKATNTPENKSRVVSTSSVLLAPHLPSLPGIKPPARAIRIGFDGAPKRPGSFVLGTDPTSCDVVLPQLPGVDHQHCALSFDGEGRLTLEDFSRAGTQVWYDWECNGDQTDYTWILSSGGSPGFPDTVRRISIDIQGVRFHLIVNQHATEGAWAAYREKVDTFCSQPRWAYGLTAGWDRASVSPVAPLFSTAPLFQHIFVKSLGSEPLSEMYLWNLAKPWEPMVKASAQEAVA